MCRGWSSNSTIFLFLWDLFPKSFTHTTKDRFRSIFSWHQLTSLSSLHMIFFNAVLQHHDSANHPSTTCTKLKSDIASRYIVNNCTALVPPVRPPQTFSSSLWIWALTTPLGQFSRNLLHLFSVEIAITEIYNYNASFWHFQSNSREAPIIF